MNVGLWQKPYFNRHFNEAGIQYRLLKLAGMPSLLGAKNDTRKLKKYM